MRARKPKTLMQRAKAGTSEREVEKQIWTLFEAARDELRKMAREGLVDANAADEYHPVRTLIRIEHDPNVPPVIRAMAAKEILSYVEVPKAAQLKLDASGNPNDLNITVVIAPWASADPRAPALPAPQDDKAFPTLKGKDGKALPPVVEVIERPKGGRIYKLEDGSEVFEI